VLELPILGLTARVMGPNLVFVLFMGASWRRVWTFPRG
jgi:hypothetical protein